MNKGDKITYPLPGNDVLHTSYEMPSTTNPETQFHAHATSINLLRFDEEGVTWIRGHHLCDSKEVAAVRVAKALAAKPADTETVEWLKLPSGGYAPALK